MGSAKGPTGLRLGRGDRGLNHTTGVYFWGEIQQEKDTMTENSYVFQWSCLCVIVVHSYQPPRHIETWLEHCIIIFHFIHLNILLPVCSTLITNSYSHDTKKAPDLCSSSQPQFDYAKFEGRTNKTALPWRESLLEGNGDLQKHPACTLDISTIEKTIINCALSAWEVKRVAWRVQKMKVFD